MSGERTVAPDFFALRRRPNRTTLETVANLARNWKFESIPLQERVMSEPWAARLIGRILLRATALEDLDDGHFKTSIWSAVVVHNLVLLARRKPA
jgi:hypothetical protein